MTSDSTTDWRPKFTGERRSVVYGEFECLLLQAQESTPRGLRWVTLGELRGLPTSSFVGAMARFGFDGTVPPEAAEEAERSRSRLFAPLFDSVDKADEP
jgi:hypothetical protein